MSASTAIGMVGESLKDLLETEMSLNPAANVTLLAPDEQGGAPRRVNLFLYKVTENAFLKNKEWEVSATNPNQITPPPLSLSLHYLMTAYAQNNDDSGNASAHEILGEAMRVLYENPIIPEANLADGLLNAREHLKIIQSPLDMDELSKIWSTFNSGYRLSVLYEISVVQLDQSPGQTMDMAPRVSSIGVPDVSAPFNVPNVTAIEPLTGPVGTVVTILGENLSGWKAYASISGNNVLSAENIVGNSFQLTVPNGLQAGYHQLRVDISKLARKTFFFEVTP